ncbi:MAG TPA: FtsX-like permease family protein [Bryobacteraceae bacterium]|nr:FtsX-like permease family protein [Bryobacteraceae bacterium]
MTFKLILENLRHRPLRTALSALLIAIPVTLILTLVGLSRGMLDESARRARGVGADILMRPPSTSFMSFSSATLPQALVKQLEREAHVALATGTVVAPVGGILSVTGVNLAEFKKMSGGLDFLEGGPFKGPDDILLEQSYAEEHKLHVDDKVKVLNHDWRVAGIFASGKLARIVLPIDVLQDLIASHGNVSQIFIKLDNPANLASVIASLKKEYEGYQILSMADIVALTSVNNVPGLRSFIRVMVGIAIVIGFAVVCLSMYMAVLQRTREIGILKSLGASRAYVLELIVAEAFVLGFAGTVLGILLSFLARWLILALVPSSLQQAIVPDWWPIAGLIALFASLLGALYPGFRAAQQDPIEALAYE